MYYGNSDTIRGGNGSKTEFTEYMDTILYYIHPVLHRLLCVKCSENLYNKWRHRFMNFINVTNGIYFGRKTPIFNNIVAVRSYIVYDCKALIPKPLDRT